MVRTICWVTTADKQTNNEHATLTDDLTGLTMVNE